ncbi:MAG: hypothetical protein M1814_006151 [Vezdaea aestivalis]|nr:MAG: hypothetical protein M1814_006151 [Vezdaea aestivalis]
MLIPIPTSLLAPTIFFLLPALISASPFPLTQDQAGSALVGMVPLHFKRMPKGGSGPRKCKGDGCEWTKKSRNESIIIGAVGFGGGLLIIGFAIWWYGFRTTGAEKKAKKEKIEAENGVEGTDDDKNEGGMSCDFCAQSLEGTCNGCSGCKEKAETEQEDTTYHGGYSEVPHESHVKMHQGGGGGGWSNAFSGLASVDI